MNFSQNANLLACNTGSKISWFCVYDEEREKEKGEGGGGKKEGKERIGKNDGKLWFIKLLWELR